MGDFKDLRSIKNYLRLKNIQFPKPEGGLITQLDDENNPYGMVVLKDRNGSVIACMPRQVYDDLRKWMPE